MLGIFDQNATTARDRERLEDLREEVTRMSDLVNELLSFSKASLQPSAIKLAPVAVLEIAERAARREGADSVQCEIAPDVRAMADPDLLLRALANLVRNAVRYAGSSGPIAIRAERAGLEVIIRVVDNGPGVPPDSVSRLFDPFYRPELARDRETGGAGLGLAIVKTCVESCQGSVSCRNLAPKGFEVAIRLCAEAC
jgi:two-component system sensor histidine kinase CpxA